MRERKIARIIVERILDKPDHTFFDTETGYKVLLRQLRFLGEQRLMVVAIDDKEKIKVVVTVHPIRERDFDYRTRSGRWI